MSTHPTPVSPELQWQADELAAYARRYGLAGLPAPMMQRMQALSERVAATGRAVPRMAHKADESALIFRLPRPSRRPD